MTKHRHTLLKLLFISIGLICSYFLIKYTLLYVYPFIIAILISILLHPIVSFLEIKWRVNRAIATAIIIFCFFLLAGSFAFFLLKKLFTESLDLIEEIPNYTTKLQVTFTNLLQYLTNFYEKIITYIPLQSAAIENVDFILDDVLEKLSTSSINLFQLVMTSSAAVLASFTYITTITIFIILFVYIMTKEMNHILLFFENKIPQRFIKKISTIHHAFIKTLFGFFKAQITLTTITAIIAFIGFSIFKIDHLLTMTLLIFIIDFLPYLGVGAVFLPWLSILFFSNQYELTIQLAILYIVIIIIRQFIEPKIIAANIGIHPLIALTILFFSIQLLGVIGLLVAPITLIVYSSLYHAQIFHFVWNYLKS